MTTLTNRIIRFTTAAALGLGLLWSAPSRGAPPNTIANSVAVCDPWNPQRCAQPDASGNLPITGSFSAAGFTPATTGTPISVTTSGVTGTLPAGAVVAAFNVGTTNTAYCKLGASATTSDIAIPPASWFAFTVGAATQLTCITASSTTTVNMVGGSGQPTGAGGGGGGSGGGAVTIADGADATQGAKADSVCGSDIGTCSLIALVKRTNQQVTAGQITAGTAGTPSTQVLSVQGVTSMTPFSSNLYVGGSAVASGTGAVGSTTPRVAVGTDTATVAGTAPATAGIAATGAAPPAGSVQVAAVASGATGGLMAGLKTCDLHAKYDASDNGSIEMVAAVSGRTIYVCGFILATGGTATNLKLVDGTGTNCATGTPVDLTPAYQLTANDKIGANSAFWNGLKTTGTNRALCVNASAGNAHQAEVWYTIQ